MSWGKLFALALLSSVLASAGCIIYSAIYKQAFYVDFSAVVGNSNMIAACSVGTILMTLGYKLGLAWKGAKVFGWLNVLYSLLSFASIAGVLGFNLPLEIEGPELFPGLVIPMHFFPVLAFFTILPFFKLNKY